MKAFTNCSRKTFFVIFNLSIILLVIINPSKLSAQTFAWAKSIGGVNASIKAPFNNISVDPFGNVYNITSFTGTVDFDPGTPTLNFNSSNGSTVIQKLNPAGNLLWARQVNCGAFTFDVYGNIYITRWFSGTEDFDPGPGVFNLTSYGYEDIFILKLNSSGNFVWAKQIGGLFSERAGFIKVSAEGVLYVTGGFGYAGSGLAGKTADLDPDPATTYELTTVGGRDGFVLTLDLDGKFKWVRQIGTAADEHVGLLATDPGNNIIYMVSSSPNASLQKITSTNELLWTAGFSNAAQFGLVTSDAAGDILLCGGYSGTIDFDPSAGTNTYTAATLQDPFSLKLNASGNLLWVSVVRANGFVNGIASDVTNNVYATGYFNGSGNIDFNPGSGTFNLKSNGGTAAFIQKLTSNGGFINALQIGGDPKGTAMARGVALSAASDVYTFFEFSGTIDADPGASKVMVKSAGQDGLVHKMTQSLANRVSPGSYSSVSCNESPVVRFYPNPTKRIFTLEAPGWFGKMTLQIVNSTGQIVYSKEINQSDRNIYLIDPGTLQKGVYFTRLSGAKVSLMQALVVQ